MADPGGGLRGLKTPPSARPAMNKLTYDYMIDELKNEAFSERE